MNREPFLDSVVFFPVHVFLVLSGHMSPDVSLVYTVVSMLHIISAGNKGQHIRPLWSLLHLGPNVITDMTFITLGFKMLLRMGLLLRLGPNVITDGTFIALGSSYYTCAFNNQVPLGRRACRLEYMYRIKSHITPPEQYSIHRQSLKVSLNRKGRSTSLLFNLVSSITLLQTLEIQRYNEPYRRT